MNLETIAPQGTGRTVKTAVYRIYNADMELLYVGQSAKPLRRIAEHAHKDWCESAAMVTMEWFETAVAASDAERAGIMSERPKHNIALAVTAPASPVADLRLVERIEQFCIKNGLSTSRFGGLAANDYSLYRDLKAGREPRRRTLERVLDYIATGVTHEEAKAGEVTQ